MGVVVSKNAVKPVTAAMPTNYEISGAVNYNTSEATYNTAAFDAPVIDNIGRQMSNGKRLVIPAQKFILAISNPVLCAMFYGPVAETKNSIDLSHYEYESLLELLRFLYYEEV
ncbi:unnamed protein product, partial [Pocillopora meandrina]